MKVNSLNCEQQIKNSSTTQPAVYITTNNKPKGVFLVTHGLNSKPSVMQDLVEFLKSLGFNVLLVTLRGHDKDSAWPSDLSAEDWIEDLRFAYCQAKNNFPTLPIYSLGYSLGGATNLALINRYPEIKFEKLILLAPAVKLKKTVQLASFLTIFAFTGLSLPSLAPADYTAHPYTSLRAYRALFAIAKRANPSNTNSSTPSTLVIQDKEDELIDFQATKNWVAKTSPEWQILAYSSDTISDLPKHLMIDKRSTGKDGWEKITSAISQYLSDSNFNHEE